MIFWVRRVERPHVEVLHAILAVDEMLGRALAQGDANEPVGQDRIPGFPRKEVLAVRTRDPDQISQVVARDPPVRPSRPGRPYRTSPSSLLEGFFADT
jgi:hypothetical protein